MEVLTERLEVRLPAHTLHLLRREAKRRGISVAQLVREAIDLLQAENQHAKVQAAEALFQVEAPIADWAKMKREIEAARLKTTLS